MKLSLTRMLFFALSLSAFYTPILAQQRLQGKVVDAQTGEPLPYATLSLKEAGLGLVSNAEGAFNLRLSEQSGTDSLIVTYLGYQPWKQAVSQLTSPLEIRLEEKILSLDEVLIIPVTPEELIEQALEKLETNYADQPALGEAFYREFLTESGQPMLIGEAVMNVRRPAIQAPEEEKAQVQILKGRVLEDTTLEGTQLSAGFEGGPLSISSLRVMPKLFAESFLEPKKFKFYDYKLKGVVPYGDRQAYHIIFSQRKKLRKKLYEGELFLDFKTLAFVSIRFRSNEDGRRFPEGPSLAQRILLRMLGVKIEVHRHQGRMDFHKEGSTWQPTFVNWRVDFDIQISEKMSKRMESKELYAISVGQEQVYTHAFTLGAPPIPASQRFTEDQSLGELTGTLDDAFWESYDVVVPTQALQDAAKVLEGKK
jgi:hypothetical protein